MTAPVANISFVSDMNGGCVVLVRDPGPHGDVIAISFMAIDQLDKVIEKLQRIRTIGAK